MKVRTRNGSDTTARTSSRQNDGGYRARANGTREERIMTVEREFDGTVQEFRERLETQLGLQMNDADAFQQDEQELTWKQAGDTGASLTFKATNRRVYITGKVHQVRSLLSVISSFAHGLGETARSVTQTARSQRGPGSHAGNSYAGSLAPSAVYAPSHASFAPSQAFSQTSVRSGSAAVAREFKPSRRLVTRDFDPQSASELKLSVNDHVKITHDPEEGNSNVHRWVYGENETTKSTGWFPLSHASEELANATQGDGEA